MSSHAPRRPSVTPWRTQVHTCLYLLLFFPWGRRTSSAFEITRPFRKAYPLFISRRPLCRRIRGSARATRLRIIAVKRETAARDSEMHGNFVSRPARETRAYFFRDASPLRERI